MATSTFPDHARPHIVVVAFPFGTHAAPLLALTARLAAAAPAAAFSFLNTAKSNAAIADAASSAEALGNVRLVEVASGVPNGYVFQGRPQEEIELFFNAAPATVEEAAGPRVTAVVCDVFMSCAGAMAERRRVPWVSVWTSGAVSLVAHLHTRRLRRVFGVDPTEIDAKMDEPLDSIPGLAKCRVRDLPEGIVFGDLDSVFSRALAQIAETSVGAAAVVVNSFEALEAAVLPHLPDLHPRFLLVPSTLLKTPPDSHQPDPHGCLPFLNSSAAPAVYVAFGSVAALPPAELTALAEALEATPFRFVWSLNEAKQRGLPDGFADRTRGKGVVVPWAPQPAVLAHPATGAFVTHCGWSSVLESVAAGVPLVCRPFFGDQRLNGRAAEAVWGVGVGVEGGRLSKEGVVRALEAVMVGEEGWKMRDRAGMLKASATEAVGEGCRAERNLSELVDVVLAGKTTVVE